jgi:hypothetical protein
VVPDPDVLADCRAALVVIFVDACRNEPARVGAGMSGSSAVLPDPEGPGGPAPVRGVDHAVEPGGQQPFLAGGGQFVLMTGCGAGEVCQYDDTGSAFTQALAKVLDPRNSARTLSEVTKAVTADMERRSRQTQGAHQAPVVRNPGMLKLAGDVVVCDGDELADAWRKAVDTSPLLSLCPAPDLVRDVVAECARRRRAATAALQDRTGLADPWTDQDYPGRVLRDTELILREAGLIAKETDPLTAGPRLRPGEAALLIAAPFLREAVLAVGIRDAAAIDPANLDRTYTPGARSDLELTPEMHQHVVRRAVGLREHAAVGAVAGGPQARGPQVGEATAAGQLAMWLVHRWLAGRSTLWDQPGAREVYALARPLIKGCLGNAGEGEATGLLQALLQAVGAQSADKRLLAKLTGDYVDNGWRTAAAVLWLAGIMAADPRQLPPVVPDLVGTGMELPLTDVRDAAGQRAEWTCGPDRVVDLHLVCEHPALHNAFEDIVARANTAAETIRSGLSLPSAQVDRLPRGFTAKGLRPARKQDDRPAYDVPLSRFQIAEEKVRELLMGRQLYGEPELAIRELYQNALDACRWRATRQEYLTRTRQDPADWAGLIQFRQGADDDGRPYLECEDNGVGMDLNTLKHVFANAGERFVYGQEFRTEQAEWADLEPSLRMVSNSQFGVGVFSYFMLADEITVVTRRQRREGDVEDQAHEVRIASSGSLFQIRPAPGRLPGGGTRIRLYLSGDAVGVSVLAALRKFLWMAEHRVRVTAPDGGETWEPGELRYEAEPGAAPPLKCGRDLWWVPGVGGLVADGIKTNVAFHGLVVNLRDEHRPQFTVDRKTVHAWARGWVNAQMSAALPELMGWPGFTLSWLWAVARQSTEQAQRIFEYAASVNQRMSVRGDAGSQDSPLPLNVVGCLTTDEELIFADDHSGVSSTIKAWRFGVWQHLGRTPRALAGMYGFERRLARVLPKRIDGFPVPDAVDSALLDAFMKSSVSDWLDERVLAVFTKLQCTPREGLRHLQKYAITGLSISTARGVSSAATVISSDDAKLLAALEPWPPTGEKWRFQLVAALIRAAIVLGQSPEDVVRRAQGVISWLELAPDLAEFMAEAVSAAERMLEVAGSAACSRLSGEMDPASLAAACGQLGLTMGEVLELCDVLAPKGVTVPARDSYPAELDAIELLALSLVDKPGARLRASQLLVVAADAAVSIGAAHQALTRLEERGLLVRPALNGAGDHVPSELEAALVADRPQADEEYAIGATAVYGTPWLRIARIIVRPPRTDESLLPTARGLIPFTAPDWQLTHVELVHAAWLFELTLAETAAALRDVYPNVRLPSIPADCFDLGVPRPAYDALLGNPYSVAWGLGFSVSVDPGDTRWELHPAAIVMSARRTGRPLGDFLALLEPFRKLGAPLPVLDEAIRDALNKVTLDAYDEYMLDKLEAPDEDASEEGRLADTSGPWIVTALLLVQTADRYGWTLAETHQRFARIAPIGVQLDYPQIELPGEIVRWEDPLVLTTFFDGQPPVISGRINPSNLEKAAEEIFGASPEEIPAKAAWLRQRLKIYAPLFSLELDALSP